jgi:methyltransferase (TIGR00027 family)
VFEVDHPATQVWKRGLLSAARISVPDGVRFVPLDLEADALARRLSEAGFDPSQPALINWLGVTIYLTPAAIEGTFSEIATFASGTEVIADFVLPAKLRDADGTAYAELVMPVAAERGEPWLTFLTPGEVCEILTGHGFWPAENVRQRDQIPASLWDRSDSLRPIAFSFVARAILR